MKLLPYNQVFYEDVVEMFYDMTKEIYPDRTIGFKQNFYRDVDKWSLDANVDVVMVVSDKDVIGFSKSFVDDNRGLTEPHYYTELTYIKPEYRKSRATFMLIDNIDKYANEMNVANVMHVRIDNGWSDTLTKYLKKPARNNTVDSSFVTITKRINNG